MRVICGDALEILKTLQDESVNCCVTSPPYWGLRDYGVDGQLGLENTPEGYVERLVGIFMEVRRVLREDGTVWLNLGDSYKEKNLVGIPWRVAFALQADGWLLRSDIVWSKTCGMPESVRDRPTKSHEHIFLLSKSKSYYYDYEAIQEPVADSSLQRYERGRSDDHKWADGGPGNQTCAKTLEHMVGNDKRNKRDVWTISPKPFKEAHFAVFPPDLIRPCVLAGCPEGGTVLDPFFGAGTTGLVAKQEGRGYIGIELNPEYVEMARARINAQCPMDRLI